MVDIVFYAGFIVLLIGLIGHVFRNRLPRLRRYLRFVFVLGVLLVLVGGWDEFRAGFIAGMNTVVSHK